MRASWFSYLVLVLLSSMTISKVYPQAIRRRLSQINNAVRQIISRLESLEELQDACTARAGNFSTSTDVLQSRTDQCGVTINGYRSTLVGVSQNLDQVDNSENSMVIDLDNTGTPDRLCLDVPSTVKECFRSFDGEPIDTIASQVVCLQEFLWEFTPVDPNTRSDAERIRDLVNLANLTRPSSGQRVRKEYRTLSLEERHRYHNALNRLHKDGMIAVFARTHRLASRRAHRGPAFLPWHRAFLALYEEALRRVDPTVSLPYWDSTIDNDMDNPTNSILWTYEYFGNGGGVVDMGPFTGWVTNNGRLERNFGKGSRLIDKNNVVEILSKCHFANISRPSPRSLEFFHDGVHVWVGGDMGAVGTAAYDPIFYMHHCYIDYIWERFRQRQKTPYCEVDPTTDYPTNDVEEGHAADDTMAGMEFYTLRDGLADWWSNEENGWYTYETSPTECPFCGGAEHLVCDTFIDSCIPDSRIQAIVEDFLPPSTTPGITTETFISSSGTTVASSSSSSASSNGRARMAFLSQSLIDDQPPPVLESRTPTLLPAIIVHDMVAEAKLIPKNRGQAFSESPDSDGRTLESSFEDAIDSVEMRLFGRRRKK